MIISLRHIMLSFALALPLVFGAWGSSSTATQTYGAGPSYGAGLFHERVAAAEAETGIQGTETYDSLFRQRMDDAINMMQSIFHGSIEELGLTENKDLDRHIFVN